jgi:hypothetical protein
MNAGRFGAGGRKSSWESISPGRYDARKEALAFLSGSRAARAAIEDSRVFFRPDESPFKRPFAFPFDKRVHSLLCA